MFKTFSPFQLFCFSSRWEGEGVNEIGKEKATGIVRVKINAKYFRPSEVVSFPLLLFTFFSFCSCSARWAGGSQPCSDLKRAFMRHLMCSTGIYHVP